MSIAGNLATMELAELLQWAATSRKTGTLVLDNGDVEKCLLFKEGRITSTESTNPKEHLGHFLVSHGLIDEVTLAKAIEMQEENRMLLGKILKTIGALSEEDLEGMLRMKAEESIYDLFSWPEGEFKFVEGEAPAFEFVPLSLNVTNLILRGTRRLDEWNRIREEIPTVRAIPVAFGALEPPEEDPGAAKILEYVDDDRTIEEIALQTHSTDFYVCSVLFHQVEAGRLKIVRLRGPAASVASRNPPGDAPSVEARRVEPEELVLAARDHLEASDFDLALRHLRAAAALDPESDEIKAETERLAARIRGELERAGISAETVPRLSGRLQDSDPDLTAQEAFLLSRIDGRADLQTIVKISPIGALETQVTLWKLLEAGHIKID